MKAIRRIFTWIVFPLIIEMGVLFYINNVYLSTTTTFHIQKVNTESDTNAMKKTMKVPVPSDGESVEASYDGSYVSYLLNHQIIVVDTKTQGIKKVIAASNYIQYYTWLNDRNRIIYFYKTYSRGSEAIQLEAYDLDINNKIKIDKLIYAPRNSHIENVTLSPLTNMIYINVVDANGYSYLYRIDIMGQITNFRLPVKRITRMYELQRKDVLLYESSNGIIRVIKNGSGYTFLSGGFSLIGTDSNDNVYVGKLDSDNKVVEIYYGTIDKSFKNWSHIKLNHAIDPNQVYILPKDNALTVTFDGKDLIDVNTGKTITGSGDILGINANYIIYKNDNNVILKLE
ncbi:MULTISPECIES: hypothetical protein [Thermoanaerobacterium]|uniref:Dipeptidylpeptidase IV N-terminal domain-containing protein n=1 Tax=Thermoanaerobacterium xylanolyticum (strain ATCC 49914 / DSM 7097 / LX-11) TaxID=858215 RepID=F6BKS8_THEXL|nr:hypothetical protein [Thermoanaerobacterium xylanolyticum]AEF18161.1 hypothetical protein Thexy_2153 [Thermoanaerobacterium xylanolyticum LX-11]